MYTQGEHEYNDSIASKKHLPKMWCGREVLVFRDLEQTPSNEIMKIKAEKAFAKLGNHQQYGQTAAGSRPPQFMNRYKWSKCQMPDDQEQYQSIKNRN